MTTNEIEREIQAMQLDRQWADEIRNTIATVRAYPQFIFYGVDEAMRETAVGLGADMWHDTLQALVNGLRILKDPQDFLKDYGDQIYGVHNWDMARFTIAEKYEDIYNKFHINNSVPFAYRLFERQNLSTIVFEKISDLEVMEYALDHRKRGAAGINAGIFPAGRSADISDFSWGGSSSNLHKLHWTRGAESSIFSIPSSSADF